MLTDAAAKAVPVRKDEWKPAFPHLETLIDRSWAGALRPLELIKLKRWSAGRVAIIGDAAHALPPNIGQGGGCAMMNALSLGVYLDRENNIPSALASWEQSERPITEHTQRISYFLGLPTTWPPALRGAALGSQADRNGSFGSAPAPRCTTNRHIKEKGAGLTPTPSLHALHHPGQIRRHHYMPALISVCSVAAFAASFCCSAAAIEAFSALVSFIC